MGVVEIFDGSEMKGDGLDGRDVSVGAVSWPKAWTVVDTNQRDLPGERWALVPCSLSPQDPVQFSQGVSRALGCFTQSSRSSTHALS